MPNGRREDDKRLGMGTSAPLQDAHLAAAATAAKEKKRLEMERKDREAKEKRAMYELEMRMIVEKLTEEIKLVGEELEKRKQLVKCMHSTKQQVEDEVKSTQSTLAILEATLTHLQKTLSQILHVKRSHLANEMTRDLASSIVGLGLLSDLTNAHSSLLRADPREVATNAFVDAPTPQKLAEIGVRLVERAARRSLDGARKRLQATEGEGKHWCWQNEKENRGQEEKSKEDEDVREVTESEGGREASQKEKSGFGLVSELLMGVCDKAIATRVEAWGYVTKAEEILQENNTMFTQMQSDSRVNKPG